MFKDFKDAARLLVEKASTSISDSHYMSSWTMLLPRGEDYVKTHSDGNQNHPNQSKSFFPNTIVWKFILFFIRFHPCLSEVSASNHQLSQLTAAANAVPGSMCRARWEGNSAPGDRPWKVWRRCCAPRCTPHCERPEDEVALLCPMLPSIHHTLYQHSFSQISICEFILN